MDDYAFWVAVLNIPVQAIFLVAGGVLVLTWFFGLVWGALRG